MKYMFASDIHGAAPAMEQVARLFELEGADRLILLGDLLYHGPRNPLPEGYAPMRVAEILNGMRDVLTCVRGNCDAEVDQMVLTFLIRADMMLLELDGCSGIVTHGHLDVLGDPPAMKPGDVYIHGHTHIAAVEQRDGYVYLNPGSVALPKEGPPSYMVYAQGRFEVKDMAGNVIMTHALAGV